MTDEGLVVHMLIEKKYPLKKEILMQMLKLKLESEEESTMALELIRFIKKVLADLEFLKQLADGNEELSIPEQRPLVRNIKSINGVSLVLVFLLGLLALAIDAACAFRAEEMPSLISCRMVAKVMAGVSDVDVLLGGILST
ncbi:hypothetical protein Tco_0846452 [Tanacetum coccineum]